MSIPPDPRRRARPRRLLLTLLLVAGVVTGCASDKPLVYSQEKFDTVSRHARSFGVPAAQSCEAARRALLSHGYLVQRSNAELVDGRKSFQPSVDTHVEIEFHVVCAAEGSGRSTVFVNALQDRYALKKTSNSASLGVGPVGSVSLPFGSSSDSLVKIASETIPSGDFYDRFFMLIEHQLAQIEDMDEDPAEAVLPRQSPPASQRDPGTQPQSRRQPGSAPSSGQASSSSHAPGQEQALQDAQPVAVAHPVR